MEPIADPDFVARKPMTHDISTGTMQSPLVLHADVTIWDWGEVTITDLGCIETFDKVMRLEKLFVCRRFEIYWCVTDTSADPQVWVVVVSTGNHCTGHWLIPAHHHQWMCMFCQSLTHFAFTFLISHWKKVKAIFFWKWPIALVQALVKHYHYHYNYYWQWKDQAMHFLTANRKWKKAKAIFC